MNIDYNPHLESPWRKSSDTEIIEGTKGCKLFILSDSLLCGFGSGGLGPSGKYSMQDIGNFIFCKYKDAGLK